MHPAEESGPLPEILGCQTRGVDLVPVFPHPPHDHPDLVDELGSPGISGASASNVGVVDLLVGPQGWGDHEEVFLAQSVLKFDGLLKSSGTCNWWGIVSTVPEGQALEDDILKSHVSLYHLQPRYEILPGVCPQIASSHIQTTKDMGGGLIGLVTPGAVVMALALALLEVAAHSTLTGTVLAQPSVLSKGFPVHGSAQCLPVNAVVEEILWNVVQFLPFLLVMAP